MSKIVCCACEEEIADDRVANPSHLSTPTRVYVLCATCKSAETDLLRATHLWKITPDADPRVQNLRNRYAYVTRAYEGLRLVSAV